MLRLLLHWPATDKENNTGKPAWIVETINSLTFPSRSVWSCRNRPGLYSLWQCSSFHKTWRTRKTWKNNFKRIPSCRSYVRAFRGYKGVYLHNTPSNVTATHTSHSSSTFWVSKWDTSAITQHPSVAYHPWLILHSHYYISGEIRHKGLTWHAAYYNSLLVSSYAPTCVPPVNRKKAKTLAQSSLRFRQYEDCGLFECAKTIQDFCHWMSVNKVCHIASGLLIVLDKQ